MLHDSDVFPGYRVLIFGLSIAVVVFSFLAIMVGISLFTTETNPAIVSSIQPDNQITYQKITFSPLNGDQSFTRSISCTGNFQFQIGQRVNLTSSFLFFKRTYRIDNLPAGCEALKF